MDTNYMLQETHSLPDLLADSFDTLREETSRFCESLNVHAIDAIYIYGSGDSYNTAVCTAQSFREYAKIPAFPLTAMEASRFIAPTLTKQQASRILSIAVSTSGEAVRTVEAAMAMNSAGCITAAITAAPLSRVGVSCEHILLAKAPAFPPSSVPLPGIRSFLVPTAALMMLAARMGVLKESLSPADETRILNELRSQSDVMKTAFDSCSVQLRSFGQLCADCGGRIELLGAGPCRGAVDFAVSKILEAQGYDARSQDTEEFAHQTFFLMDTDRLPTVLVMPSGSRSLPRSLEILTVLKQLCRPVLLLTDGHLGIAPSDGLTIVRLDRPVSGCIIPLTFACVLTCLASVIPLREGDTYMHGHLGIYNEDHIPTVKNGGIQT